MASHIYSLSDRLPFGKYKGMTIRDIIATAPDYVDWCKRKVSGFRLDEDAEALFYSHVSARVGSIPNGAADVAIEPEPVASVSSGLEILDYSERIRGSYWKKAIELADDAVIVCDFAYLQARQAISLITEDFAAASARGIQLEIPF